jgi:hypothetical protein
MIFISCFVVFVCIFSWTFWEEKTNENKRSTRMLMFLCNLDAPEKEKTRNGKMCK